MNKLVIGNQKAYMNVEQVSLFLESIDLIKNKNIIICPTSIYIPYFLNHNFSVGIQNIALSSDGANTGEVNASQASNMGIEYVILGHSEVRSHLNEDDYNINIKIKEALKNNLKIILCIGEEKESFNTKKVLKKSLINSLMDLESLENIIIAYEPIWAIGTGLTPTNKKIEETVIYIKKVIKDLFNYDIKVLYGGSVNEKNIEEINEIDVLDGVLVGKCSTDIGKFLSIIEVVVNQ